MKNFTSLCLLFCFLSPCAWSQQPGSDSKNDYDYILHNRIIEHVTENNQSIIRFGEAAGPGIAWVKGMEFVEGVIEFDAKGRDVLQKSFIGIAFHGKDNETYETVYFRPFNFQAADAVRKIHAVQYSFEPDYGFQQLRNTRKDEFEAAIKPSEIKATDWFHVRIEVRNNKITAFLNDAKEPCLEVSTLNPTPSGNKIGYWVGNNSNGEFANLTISK